MGMASWVKGTEPPQCHARKAEVYGTHDASLAVLPWSASGYSFSCAAAAAIAGGGAGRARGQRVGSGLAPCGPLAGHGGSRLCGQVLVQASAAALSTPACCCCKLWCRPVWSEVRVGRHVVCNGTEQPAPCGMSACLPHPIPTGVAPATPSTSSSRRSSESWLLWLRRQSPWQHRAPPPWRCLPPLLGRRVQLPAVPSQALAMRWPCPRCRRPQR